MANKKKCETGGKLVKSMNIDESNAGMPLNKVITSPWNDPVNMQATWRDIQRHKWANLYGSMIDTNTPAPFNYNDPNIQARMKEKGLTKEMIDTYNPSNYINNISPEDLAKQYSTPSNYAQGGKVVPKYFLGGIAGAAGSLLGKGSSASGIIGALGKTGIVDKGLEGMSNGEEGWLQSTFGGDGENEQLSNTMQDLGSIGKGVWGGVKMGSSFGPMGMIAGGALGAMKGIVDVGNTASARVQSKIDANRAEEFANLNNRGLTAGTTPVDSMKEQSYAPSFAQGGQVMKQKVELERGEPFRTPDGKMAVVKDQPELSHSKGGATMDMEVGTEILGNKKDPVTNKTFKEYGKSIASMNQKYNKLLDESKNKYSQNAAKAMLAKTQQKWNAAFARQEEGKDNKFAKGGYVPKAVDGLEVPGYMGFGSNLNLGGGYGDTPQLGFMQDMLHNTPSAEGSSGSTGINMSNDSNIGNWVNNQGGWGSLGNKALSLAPVAYNLIQGIRPAEQLNAGDYYNPQYGKSIDLMANRRFNVDPMLEANRNASAISKYNLQNAGASAGQQYSGFQALAANRMRADAMARAQEQNMNNQYKGEEAGLRSELGARRAATDLTIKDYNMRSDAARRAMLGQAFTQLGQYGQSQELMKGQKGRDEERLAILSEMYPFFKQQFGDIKFG